MKKNILKSIIASTLVASMLLSGTVSAAGVDTNTNTNTNANTNVNTGTTTIPTSHWVSTNGKWTYVQEDGTQAKGWKQVNGKWYHFDSNGVMETGWKLLDGGYYFLNPNGDMAVGWVQDNGRWYNLNASGRMNFNTWVGNYYVKNSGAMAVNEYTPDGYWVGGSGVWDGRPSFTFDGKPVSQLTYNPIFTYPITSDKLENFELMQPTEVVEVGIAKITTGFTADQMATLNKCLSDNKIMFDTFEASKSYSHALTVGSPYLNAINSALNARIILETTKTMTPEVKSMLKELMYTYSYIGRECPIVAKKHGWTTLDALEGSFTEEAVNFPFVGGICDIYDYTSKILNGTMTEIETPSIPR